MAMDNTTKKKGVTGDFLITPKGRVSFPHLAKPNDSGEYPDNKYKVTLLMPKATTDLGPIKKAMLAVAAKAWPGKPAKDIRWAVQDGDKKFTKAGQVIGGYEGCWYITCKSVRRPGCIDSLKNNIDPIEVYAGCWARLSVTPGSYESTETVKQADGTRTTETLYGVTLYLNNVQKLEDGEPMKGARTAQSDFPDDVGADDPANYAQPSQPQNTPAKVSAAPAGPTSAPAKATAPAATPKAPEPAQGASDDEMPF